MYDWSSMAIIEPTPYVVIVWARLTAPSGFRVMSASPFRPGCRVRPPRSAISSLQVKVGLGIDVTQAPQCGDGLREIGIGIGAEQRLVGIPTLTALEPGLGLVGQRRIVVGELHPFRDEVVEVFLGSGQLVLVNRLDPKQDQLDQLFDPAHVLPY